MMSEKAKEARREYMREYMRRWRAKNKDRYNEMCRTYRKNNPNKMKEYQARYWERKAKEMA